MFPRCGDVEKFRRATASRVEKQGSGGLGCGLSQGLSDVDILPRSLSRGIEDSGGPERLPVAEFTELYRQARRALLDVEARWRGHQTEIFNVACIVCALSLSTKLYKHRS